MTKFHYLYNYKFRYEWKKINSIDLITIDFNMQAFDLFWRIAERALDSYGLWQPGPVLVNQEWNSVTADLFSHPLKAS